MTKYANYYPSSGLYHVSLPLVMGTRLDALLFGDDEQQLDDVWTEIEADLLHIEKTLNRFDRESEVSKVNASACLSPVTLSDELWSILLDCRRYYELTDGCFDVTLSDFSKIAFMEDSRSIFFGEYGMALDFGGYAKGYALERMRERLVVAGIRRALVNFGNSSTLAAGAHPYGDSWPTGIENPFTGTVLATVNLRDASLSASGSAPSRLLHIVNPASGVLTGSERLVAVVSENPLDAEVLTTAWIASGSESEPAWMSRFTLQNTFTFTLRTP